MIKTSEKVLNSWISKVREPFIKISEGPKFHHTVKSRQHASIQMQSKWVHKEISTENLLKAMRERLSGAKLTRLFPGKGSGHSI
jgi:hypothetical protein